MKQIKIRESNSRLTTHYNPCGLLLWQGTCGRNVRCFNPFCSVSVKHCGMLPGAVSNHTCFSFLGFFLCMIGRHKTKAKVLLLQKLNLDIIVY